MGTTPAFLLLLPTSPCPLRVGISLPVPARAVGGCQQQLVLTQSPGSGWGGMYNEQRRGDDNFGLTSPAFAEQILMPAGSWRQIPGPRVGC